MRDLTIINTVNLTAPNTELTLQSKEGAQAFKEVLTQSIGRDKAAAPAPQKTEASQSSHQTTDKTQTKASDEKQPNSPADDESTGVVSESPTESTNLKAIKARLQKESLTAAKKKAEAAEQNPNATQNTALVAALQLPPMGVKEVDMATKSDETDPSTNSAVPLELRDKGMANLETNKLGDKLDAKLEQASDKLAKSDSRNAAENEKEVPANIKSEKFSEQLSSAMTAQSPSTHDKSAASELTKPSLAMGKLKEMATTIQTTLSPAAAINNAQVIAPTQAQTAFNNIINPTFGQTGWNEAVNQKVVWMVGAQEQTATLTLNPPDLGPVQVVVSVNNDKADTTFVSDNPEVRKALQDGLADLRNQLDQAGVTLGQTNISNQQQFQQFRQSQGEAFQPASHNNAANHASSQAREHANARSAVIRTSQGLVDTFA